MTDAASKTPPDDAVAVKPCRYCGVKFAQGRRHAEFCSPEHRRLFHNTRRDLGLCLLEICEADDDLQHLVVQANRRREDKIARRA